MKIEEFRKVVLDKIHNDYDYEKRIPMNDYETALDEILNLIDKEEITPKEIEEELTKSEDYIHNYADSLVNPYTNDLLRWYLEDIYRIDYMEDAISELGAKDGFQVLSWGQYIYWGRVLYEVLEICVDIVKSMKKEVIDL